VNLRHKLLQDALYGRLVDEYGIASVGTEHPTGLATYLDAVVQTPGGYRYYEIKTAPTAKACLREALGQLSEYSLWPGSQPAVRLIVVGEHALDDEVQQYLATLRGLGFPLDYEQITMPSSS
jgi:hypothetical protein